MLDIGWTELLIIAAVAIVIIGPKDLPKAMRVIGQWSTKIKGMARDFQGQFDDALREAELDTIDKDLRGNVSGIRDINEQVSKTNSEIRRVLDRPGEVAKAEKAKKAEEAATAKPVVGGEAKAKPAGNGEVKPATAAKPAKPDAKPTANAAAEPVPTKPAAKAAAPASDPPAVAVAAGDPKP